MKPRTFGMPPISVAHNVELASGARAERIRLEKMADKAEAIRRFGFPLHIAKAIVTGFDDHGLPLRLIKCEHLARNAIDGKAWKNNIEKGRLTKRRILILAGVAGTGKTLTSCRIVEDLSGETQGGLYLAAKTIAREPEWGPTVSLAGRVRHCVIDDVGEESDWAKKRIAQLMRDRYDSPGLTFITTNLEYAEFMDRYNEKNRVQSAFGQVGAWIKCTEIVRPGSDQ